MWPPVRAPSFRREVHVCTSLPPVSPVFTHPPQHLAAGQAYVQAQPPPVQQVQRTVQQVRQAQQAAQARAQVPSQMALFPPCFQQLRGDLDCIENKIADKRAFWGCLQVLYCIFSVAALMVFVEQPDTIVGDCFDPDEFSAVELYEFRTSHYGDPSDKFVRLTTRNVRLQAPTHPFAKPERAPRSQFNYRDAEERDRQRSSWAPHAQTCRALAAATPIAHDMPPAIRTQEVAILLRRADASRCAPMLLAELHAAGERGGALGRHEVAARAPRGTGGRGRPVGGAGGRGRSREEEHYADAHLDGHFLSCALELSRRGVEIQKKT